MANESVGARQRFFSRQVHMPVWKGSMAGENEKTIINILGQLGFVEGKDYVRQYPIGERFVIDFAFVNEQVALEVDGDGHRQRKQKELDRKRDSYLRTINWVPMRFWDDDLSGERGSFNKALIREVVAERRADWQAGRLYQCDFPNYVEQDFQK